MLLAVTPAAGAAQAQGPPKLDARAWLLLDARDGERLAAKSASRQLPIASATKLMTAYLTLKDLPLGRRLKAPAYSGAPAESVLGLREGEKISVRDLLVAMMLPSANDAAFTLAEGVSGSVSRFVKRMNGAARKLGLDDTSYANPIGLDEGANGSSARDLAALTLELREDRRFRKIVAKPEATLKSGETTRTVQTRNSLLLADGSVDGVKTGHTQGAGYVLVASAERKGVPLISVVLGAPSEGARDAESGRLLDYGFSLYKERRVVRRGEELGTVPVGDGDESLALEAAAGERLTSRPDQSVEIELLAPDQVEGPIEKGERLGRALVTLDGERVASVPAIAAVAVEAPGFIDDLGPTLAVILIAGGSILVLMAFSVAYLRRDRSGRPEPEIGRTEEERRLSQQRRSRRRQQGGRN